MTEQRQTLKHRFLSAAGWADAKVEPIPGDASFRSYTRLIKGNTCAILMDAPPPQEDVRPFAAITHYLEDQGFHAPHILDADVDAGLLLLEDLGDARFSGILRDRPDQEMALYSAAVDVLVTLVKLDVPNTLPGIDGGTYRIAPYDRGPLLREVELFTDWALPSLTGRESDKALRDDFKAAWTDAFSFLEGRLEALVLRDFHVDNLMALEGGGVGLLDFQDALIGDAAYDLVSLLQDARRDVSIRCEEDLRRYFIEETGVQDAAAFHKAYALLGAQRSIKIIGIFTRLWKRDGKPRYLDHLPRLWRLVERNFEHPALAPVKAWFDDHVPADLRQIDPRSKAA